MQNTESTRRFARCGAPLLTIVVTAPVLVDRLGWSARGAPFLRRSTSAWSIHSGVITLINADSRFTHCGMPGSEMLQSRLKFVVTARGAWICSVVWIGWWPLSSIYSAKKALVIVCKGSTDLNE